MYYAVYVFLYAEFSESLVLQTSSLGLLFAVAFFEAKTTLF